MQFNRVTISNTVPRLDTQGKILDAHGGPHFNVFNTPAGRRYFNYGVHYMDLDKSKPGFYYVSYSSSDFENWTYHGSLMPEGSPTGFYYRPHVIYHPETKKYVLWFLYFSMYGSKWAGPPDPRYHRPGAQKGIAVSDSPTGPFAIVDIGISLSHAHAGDHDLFLDDDGVAYIIYTCHTEDFKIYIDKLSPDFMKSTMEHCAVDPDDIGNLYPTKYPGCEAPAMFKRNDIYYTLFGSRTDRGKEGGGLRVYTSRKPLGPYTYRSNINRDGDGNVIIPSQQNTAVPINTSSGIEFIWVGDRWETMPALGDSYQHWQLLEFEEDGSIKPLKSIPEWTMEVEVFSQIRKEKQ